MDLDRRRELAERLLAADVRAKPRAREFTPPVAWLLGPEMLGAVKQLALHALYKGEFDPHDWMRAEVVTYEAPAEGELWLDYIADIGDSQAATYTNALVLQDDLYVEGSLDALPHAAPARLPALAGELPAGWSRLPRGRVLLVGGDTAYPVADAINLSDHVRQPFTWAYRDLVAAGRLLDDDWHAPPPTDLYGIPGNHDYYDLLSGFGHVFRAPPEDTSDGARAVRRAISLIGYRARQTASYAALDLPWGWRVWLLDPGERDMDYRQECFFREHGVADKMIVLLPTPPVVFGRVLAERSWLRAMTALGLALPFLAGEAVLRDGKPADPAPRELALEQCRIDLAGDMHCYQRFGAADGAGNYAAVVSGSGGAFSHPTVTDFGEAPALATYPAPDDARRAFARKLFAPFTVMSNGAIIVITFALAALVCGGSIRDDTRVVTDSVFAALGVHARAPTGWRHLEGAGAMLAAIVAGIVMLAIAQRYTAWITRGLRQPLASQPAFLRIVHRIPGGAVLAERGFVPAWLLVIGALLLPTVVSQLVPMPTASALLFQLLFVGAIVVIGGGMLALALTGGAEYQRPGERWPFWLFGAGHAAIQLLLPLAIVRLGLVDLRGLAAAFAIFATSALASYALARRREAWARWLLAATWAGHAIAIGWVLVAASHGEPVTPMTTAEAIALVAFAGGVGAFVGCYELGWYLSVALAFRGHNNEAGVASRIDRFNQFIRFRIQPDRITGYVIATDRPVTELRDATAHVVDVFTIAPNRPRGR